MTASRPAHHVADPTDRAPRRRASTRHGWAIVAWSASLAGIVASFVTVAGLASGAIPSPPDGGLLTSSVFGLMQAAFGVTGALLVTRVPGNRVGWLMWGAGLCLAVGIVGSTAPGWAMTNGGPMPGWTIVAMLAEPATQIAFSFIVGFLLLLYPTGSLPSRRWLPISMVASVLLVTNVAAPALAPGPLSATYPVPNPFGIEALTPAQDSIAAVQSVLIIVVLPACALALVTRFRHGGSVVRQQIKWFALTALAAVGFIAIAVLAPTEAVANLFWGIAMMLVSLLPVTIGLAILRYRLYEIDRLISRTVSWAIVTGLLVAVFAGAILALQAMLAGLTQGSTLAVAASTLVVFALFQPLRRRVQVTVDRRFDRARWDAERVVASFAAEVRDQVELERLRHAVVSVVDEAIAPAASAIWLRSKT